MTAAPDTLLRSLTIQLRVVGALLLREVITRFGRRNLGVLWLIAEPMIFTIGVTVMWTLARQGHSATALPIVAFAVTGYSTVLMWRNSVGHCVHAIQQNRNLLYHRNVQVIDVLITRIVLEVAGATASFMVLTLFFIAVGLVAPPHDLMGVLEGWLMLTWFAFGLSLTIGAASAYGEIVARIWHPTAYLLFPLSGAAYMVDWLPPAAREAALLLPMVHGTEMIREGFFGNLVRTHYDTGYMAMCCLALTLAGMLLIRKAGRHVEAP